MAPRVVRVEAANLDYIDPRTETAAKCNYCAHRLEVGLEPPCVSVCPTPAIVAGDIDAPESRIAQLVGRVRKPEKGTRPKLFHIEGEALPLEPAVAPPGSAYLFAEAPQPAILLRPEAASIICLEEPELGLHPDAVSLIASLLVEASAVTQLIVTTHSDGLVSALSEHVEAVLVAEHDVMCPATTRAATGTVPSARA